MMCLVSWCAFKKLWGLLSLQRLAKHRVSFLRTLGAKPGNAKDLPTHVPPLLHTIYGSEEQPASRTERQKGGWHHWCPQHEPGHRSMRTSPRQTNRTPATESMWLGTSFDCVRRVKFENEEVEVFCAGEVLQQ